MSGQMGKTGLSVARALSRAQSRIEHAVPKAQGMILIPEGPFVMGSEDGAEGERPAHTVRVDAFWIDEAPVTNRQFAEFVVATGYVTDAERRGSAWGYDGTDYRSIDRHSWRSCASNRDDHPVVLVSWFDAVAYAKWAGKRLLTEAEWEKAARGGMEGVYPWGNDSPNGSQSNFAQSPTMTPPTTPVKTFAANGYGLYDMVGNVWQWCGDWFDSGYYSVSSTTDPVGPESGRHRVRRGGAWNVIQPFRLRCANRGAFDPSATAPNIGLRCAVNDQWA